jgi:predicted RNase H-like HicB family nuclease
MITRSKAKRALMSKYMKLPWSYIVKQEEGYYIVSVMEMPGVASDGKTITEAMKNIKEALYATIELYLKQGKEIPLAPDMSKYKGKISYRTSPDRHYKISRIAREKDCSISKTLDMLVDEGFSKIQKRR